MDWLYMLYCVIYSFSKSELFNFWCFIDIVMVICYVNSVFIYSIIGMQVSNLVERKVRQIVGPLATPTQNSLVWTGNAGMAIQYLAWWTTALRFFLRCRILVPPLSAFFYIGVVEASDILYSYCNSVELIEVEPDYYFTLVKGLYSPSLLSSSTSESMARLSCAMIEWRLNRGPPKADFIVAKSPSKPLNIFISVSWLKCSTV